MREVWFRQSSHAELHHQPPGFACFPWPHGRLAKGSGYSNNIHYTHGSTLRTFEEIFAVRPLLRDVSKETDLSDLFRVFP